MRCKKWIATVVSAAMVFTCLSAAVFAENEYIPNDTEKVAKIGEKEYTFAQALEAVGTGETIEMISDLTVETGYEVAADKEFTLDLAGHTLYGIQNSSTGRSPYFLNNAGKITIVDSSEEQTGTIDSRGVQTATSGGTFDIQGGTFISHDSNGGACVWIYEGSTLYISGGTFTTVHVGSPGDSTGIGCVNNSGTAVITGGTFNDINRRTYAVISTGHIEITPAEGKEVIVHGAHGGLGIDAGTAVVNGGSYSSDDYYGLYVSNDGKGADPMQAAVTVNNGTFSGKSYSVWIGSDYNNPVNSTIDIYGGTFEKPLNAQDVTRPNAIQIYGGTYSTNVNEFTPNGYRAVQNANGTYTIETSAATVIDTASTGNYSVTLNSLKANIDEQIDHTVTATYQVVLDTPSAEDRAVAEAATADATQDTKELVDIKVIKTVNGQSEEVAVTNQMVTLALSAPVKDANVKVYHITNNVAEEVQSITIHAATNSISFIAPSFSTYAVLYNAGDVAEDDITPNITVSLEETGAAGEYNVVLKADDTKLINRFMSAELGIVYTPATGAIGCEVVGVGNVVVNPQMEDSDVTGYEFHMNGTGASGLTGGALNIGQIRLSGVGTGTLSVDTAYSNIVNTAERADSITNKYVPGGTMNLILPDEVSVELTAPKQNLTVNVTFPNNISDNAAAYQDMKATISGGDLAEDIVVNFGSDEEVALVDNAYTFTQELTENTTYTVTISGAGYRTTRYSVNMAEDKVLTFWNNVMDEAKVIETGKDTSAVKTNFLAGDIVADNNINIYDLSAVVSYFGTVNVTDAASQYAKYDLNRDGVIDSKDVALVLVSWGN